MKQKRLFAALALVLTATLSVLAGGGWKLNQARAEAEEAFFEGTAGFSVYNDLMELRETGYNLLRIAEEAGQSGTSAQRIESLRGEAAFAWTQLDEADSPDECAAAYHALSDSLAGLNEAVAAADSPLFDRWERQYRSFAEYESHLRFDRYYDEKAAAYNQLLRDPLTALIGTLSWNGPMPRFAQDG